MLIVMLFAALAQEPAPPAEPLPPLIDRSGMLLEVGLPQQDVAMWQSAIVGFGAGHFYAGEEDVGALLLILQGVGAGLMIAGASKDNRGLLYAGGAVFGSSRLVDIAAAPYAARRQAIARLRDPHYTGEPPRVERAETIE
jgi:hypothetical protein